MPSAGGIQDAASLTSWTMSGGIMNSAIIDHGDRATEVADDGSESGAEDGTDRPGERRGGEELGDATGRDQEAVLGARQRQGDPADDERLTDEPQQRRRRAEPR